MTSQNGFVLRLLCAPDRQGIHKQEPIMRKEVLWDITANSHLRIHNHEVQWFQNIDPLSISVRFQGKIINLFSVHKHRSLHFLASASDASEKGIITRGPCAIHWLWVMWAVAIKCWNCTWDPLINIYQWFGYINQRNGCIVLDAFYNTRHFFLNFEEIWYRDEYQTAVIF